jgi:alpha-methylacyl-CoA racemase
MTAVGQWRAERGTNLLDSGFPCYDVYRCADDRYVAVGALEERFYTTLLAGLELDTVPDRTDPGQWPALRRVLAERFASRTRDEWAARFAGTDACVTPVLTVGEAERGYLVRDGLRQPAPAPRFARTPAELPGPAPEPGRHTREILTGAGLTEAEIEALYRTGAAR